MDKGFNLSCNNAELYQDADSHLILRNLVSDADIKIYGNDGGTDKLLLHFDVSVPSLLVKYAINLADSLKLTLGTGSDAEFYVASDDLYIKNVTSDKDIIFSVNDGGSAKELLKLDASAPDVLIPLDSAKLKLGAGGDLEVSVVSDDAIIRNITVDKDILIYGNDGTVDTLLMTFDSSFPSVNVPVQLQANKGLVVAGTVTTNVDMTTCVSTNAFKFAAANGGATVGAMTAKSPENDAEAGFITIVVDSTSYEIPFYAKA